MAITGDLLPCIWCGFPTTLVDGQDCYQSGLARDTVEGRKKEQKKRFVPSYKKNYYTPPIDLKKVWDDTDVRVVRGKIDKPVPTAPLEEPVDTLRTRIVRDD